MRRDSSETKRKILTVCVRLFLEQGYKNTSVSQIVDEAGVARGSYLNLFPTKDRILLELTETMFGGQFGVARSIADSKLPPVYAYAVETAIQLTLTELNENLREIYIEAYSLPDTSEYIYLHTTAELKQIFGENVHCFFIEPTQAPCMLLGMVTGLFNNISVQDIGLSGNTVADGLAVGRSSGFIGEYIMPFLSGSFTIKDKRIFDYMKLLWQEEGIFLEPSACAAIHGPVCMGHSAVMDEYRYDNNLNRCMERATHIIWATGGSLVPEGEKEQLLHKK